MLGPVKNLVAVLLFSSSYFASAQLASTAHTANGIELSNSQLTLRVDALRDDVLRVRIFPVGHPAEDASWAVLPASRTARVAVTPESDGFRTKALRVTVDKDLRLTIADLNGHVLESDALPVAWSADGFKVTKVKTADDHYFGLGDKPGPLDLRLAGVYRPDLQVNPILSPDARGPRAGCAVRQHLPYVF
jgi:alpha-glucosidase